MANSGELRHLGTYSADIMGKYAKGKIPEKKVPRIETTFIAINPTDKYDGVRSTRSK